MVTPFQITKSQAIEQITAQLEGPVALETFVDRVLARWPSKAKSPKSSVRTTIKTEYLGKNLLLLDENTLIPLNLAMKGVVFRVPLSRKEVNRGWLNLFPAFFYMCKMGLPPENFWLEETNGRTIPVNVESIKIRRRTIFGAQEVEQLAFNLGWWYKKHKVRRNDSLLITILDWETGRFQLQPEPAKVSKKHRAEIQAQNRALADHLFNALENAKDEYVWGRIAIPTAYVHLKGQGDIPPDHWLDILEGDARVQWDGNAIRYAESQSLFEAFMPEELQGATEKPKPLSQAQAGQVYRFKAFLKYRKGLWRRIEIQGGQTLFDLDELLRTVFKHDHFDHLSGFWKLVRRGTGRRFREVDLGTINPFEGGEAAEMRIADLELSVGQKLKYVYDFGDWIEHRLELEAVVPPEQDTEYPHLIAQNKPRYKYCETCQQAGRKTVATWICLTCSNAEQRGVLFCEACLEAHDEEHYAEEMIY